MNIRNSCHLRPALSSMLFFFSISLSLLAQSNGIPLNSLVLNGSATLMSNRIQLTDTFSQAGSAFVATPYTLGPNDSFEVTFLYNALETGSGPGDGLAFIAQNTAMGPNFPG